MFGQIIYKAICGKWNIPYYSIKETNIKGKRNIDVIMDVSLCIFACMQICMSDLHPSMYICNLCKFKF